MTIKSILALVDGGPLSQSTLETAAIVAKSFDAYLEALHVQADPATLVPIVGEGMSGAMVEQVMDAMAKAVDTRSNKARSAYDAVLRQAGVAITRARGDSIMSVGTPSIADGSRSFLGIIESGSFCAT